MGYVYKITNTVNGKAYIGISIYEPTQGRIKDHLTGRGNRVIANAVKKYGKDVFIYEVLEANVFDEFLPELEVFYIAQFNTVVPHGYNLTHGGDHAIPSADSRRKMSESSRGEKHPNFGKHLSPETRRKISEANKGKHNRPHSKETRRKISEAKKGEKNPFFGKKHSEETRRKISEAGKDRKHSAETRHKMSETQKGITLSTETRRKISEAHKGKKLSEEHRRKISEAGKGRKSPNFGKSPSEETRRKISEAGKGRKHSEEHRRKISEALRHPEYAPCYDLFRSLSFDMPLKDKRKLLYQAFPDVSQGTIYRWVSKWKPSD